MSEIQPVGIDLGTTYSVVAQLDSHGIARTIPNAEGDLTTPSAVLFDDDMIVVGKEALKAAAATPELVAQYAKREMGNANFSQPINGEYFPPEVIQSLVLEKLKQDTEAKIGRCQDAVITVPAYFNEPKRKATQDAGKMAGFNVLDIINEPTAAAIAFGIQEGFLTADGESQRNETILVYDLGGGTFDVSVMSIDGKNYKVLATDGDFKLGGVDWDDRIIESLADAFVQQHQFDPRHDAGAHQRLRREAEEAKRSLSARAKVGVTFEHAGKTIRLDLSRSDFEAKTANLLDRTRFTTAKLIRDAGLKWKDLTRILLVGGSTRMPMVAAMLERESGKAVDRSLAADEAVAHGAAIYASLLKKSERLPRDVAVTNVNSHSLGVLGVETATGRPRSCTLLPRNTALPAKRSAAFTTARDGQTSVRVNIIEGGDASGNHSTPIGECIIRDLPPTLPAGTQVVVSFRYANNGRLSVKARIPSLERAAKLHIDRKSGLSDTLVDEWGKRIRNGMKPLNIES